MSQRDLTLLVGLGIGGALLYWLVNRQSAAPASFAANPITSISDAVVSAVSGWKNVGSGPTWVPVLNATEQQLGIPTDLLARLAYQESHFREEIIRGTLASPAGALGIMQLMPQFFSSVAAAKPYTDDAVNAQIAEGAANLVSQYESFGSWDLALAAYNAGPGAVQKAGGIPAFTETQNYVAQILADVPAAANA